ncbi:MAG: DUF302 domain-containing protein [Pseudomonadota bacterium]
MKAVATNTIEVGLAARTPASALPSTPVATSASMPGSRLVDSAHGFPETIARLDTAVGKRPLKVFAVIDHAGGAATLGTRIEPSRLLIIGNPALGTPFIEANPAFAHELPLRILVYVEAGQTRLAYPDIPALSRAYGITADQAPIDQVSATLDAILSETTAPAG